LTIGLDDIRRYPWLPSLKELYQNIAHMDRVEFVKYFFSKFEEENYKPRIINIFKASFENYERINDYTADELNVYIYPMLRILLEVLDKKRILNRIANLYSKHANYELEEDQIEILYHIAHDLSLDVKFYDEENALIIKKEYNKQDVRRDIKANFSIHFTDYLKLATYLHDRYRKLSHQSLIKGYVYLNRKGLARLLQEFVRNKMINIGSLERPNLAILKQELLTIEEFNELYELISQEWDNIKTDITPLDITFRKGENIKDLFPPCIREILNKADEQQNLIHNERLILVFFLLALNYPIEEITNIFSRLPDFDHGKTTYQIEFAKKKGYVPHSCDTIKSLKLCMAKKYNDEVCLKGYFAPSLSEQRQIKHPLSYVGLKKYRQQKKKSIQKQNGENSE